VLYGAAAQLEIGKITLPALGRNFLHAARLGFTHPRSGVWIDLRTPLPPQLHTFLHELAAAAGHDARTNDSQRIDAMLANYL
jgi:hypothetical protein